MDVLAIWTDGCMDMPWGFGGFGVIGSFGMVTPGYWRAVWEKG